MGAGPLAAPQALVGARDGHSQSSPRFPVGSAACVGLPFPVNEEDIDGSEDLLSGCVYRGYCGQ